MHLILERLFNEFLSNMWELTSDINDVLMNVVQLSSSV